MCIILIESVPAHCIAVSRSVEQVDWFWVRVWSVWVGPGDGAWRW